MLFQSLGFIVIFLPIVLAGYFLLCRLAGDREQIRQLPLWWLTGASLVFYGLFHLLFPVLLAGSAVITFSLTRWMKGQAAYPARVKAIEATGILLHLAVLFLFKYYDFFIGQINLLCFCNYGSNFPTNEWLKVTGQVRYYEDDSQGKKMAVPCLVVDDYVVTSAPENDIIYFG